MKNLLFISVLILVSCSSKHKTEMVNTASSDFSKNPPAFNDNEELYIVYKIGHDTLDPNGNKCKMVEMKSKTNKIFTSCIQDNLPAVGDSIRVGYDKSGMPYIVRFIKK